MNASSLRGKRHVSLVHAIGITALLLAGVGIVSYLFVRGGIESGDSPKQKGNPTYIAEKQTTPDVKRTEPQKPVPEKKPRYWERPTTNGLSACQIAKWKFANTRPPSYTNNYIHSRERAPFEIFGTRAENEIACLLTMDPGQGLVGSPNYGNQFRDEFMKSFETPIIISSGDGEFEKRLKKDMIDAKIELKQRIADGEDICQIMTDTRNEMMRLSQLRQDIIESTHNLIREEASSTSDIDDFVKAANTVLENNGIAPIMVNPLTKRMLRKRLERR